MRACAPLIFADIPVETAIGKMRRRNEKTMRSHIKAASSCFTRNDGKACEKIREGARAKKLRKSDDLMQRQGIVLAAGHAAFAAVLSGCGNSEEAADDTATGARTTAFPKRPLRER